MKQAVEPVSLITELLQVNWDIKGVYCTQVYIKTEANGWPPLIRP